MSDFNWCHGTKCHVYDTQDRVRGVKGNKVLRTRKVKRSNYVSPQSSWNYFCSHTCQQDFWNEYGAQIRAIAPRNEPLETRIEINTETRQDWYGNDYETKVIRPIQP
jgi:hypothetical protein